jgi:hypothetical protein
MRGADHPFYQDDEPQRWFSTSEPEFFPTVTTFGGERAEQQVHHGPQQGGSAGVEARFGACGGSVPPKVVNEGEAGVDSAPISCRPGLRNARLLCPRQDSRYIGQLENAWLS